MKRLLLSISTCVCLTAHAGIFDGNVLYKHLSESSSSNVSWGFAHGYIAGVHDAGDSVTHCTPAKVNVSQLADMVKNFMDSTPAIRHMPADAIVNFVFQKAWPCEKKKGNTL